MNRKTSLGRVLLLCWTIFFLRLLPASAQQAPAPVNSFGSITGTVADAQGALISGAHLMLSHANADPDRDPAQQAISASDGRFSFDRVVAGDFTLSISLHGFISSIIKRTLQPEQQLALPPVTLKLATAVFAVEVVPDSPYVAEQQLHLEEQQRLIGFFPNFFVSYHWNAPPLTTRQKYSLAWANGRDPGNLLLVGTVAGVQQASNDFSGYRQGAQGYGKRFGADLANLEVGTFMGGAILPSAFHQDPRYFYKGTGPIRSRILYSLSSAIICRGDNGHRQPAFAGVLGDLSAGAISNLYYPASNRGVALTFENGLLGVAGDALNGLFQEFVFRKLTPSTNKRSPQP